MATSSIANRNNFIRWNKVTGLYKEGQLQDFKLPSAEDLKTLADWNEGTISSNTWNDVKISNGVCIAVGDSGVISRSLDGENFIDITSPVSSDLQAVTSDGNGNWLAIADTGQGDERVIRSNDNGITWKTIEDEYDVENSSLLQTEDVSTNTQVVRGVVFNSDGTKMFLLDGFSMAVDEYALSTAYNLNTSSYTSTYSVSGQASDVAGIAFSSDGTKMYVSDFNTFNLYEYDLSTGFDVSTSSYSGKSLSISATSNPRGVWISNDGTKIFIASQNSPSSNLSRVIAYDLSTPYDVSTGLISGTNELDLSSVNRDPSGIFFTSNGMILFVIAKGNVVGSREIYKYTLTSPYDLTTATQQQVKNVNSIANDPYGIFINPEGYRFYFVSENSGEVYALSSAAVIEENSWEDVFYAFNKYIAVSSDGTTRAIYSSDGITWSNGSGFAATSYRRLAFGNSILMASADSSGIMTTTDGINWTTGTQPVTVRALGFGLGFFVSADLSNNIHYSKNGSSWTAVSSAFTGVPSDIDFGIGVLVLTGTTTFYSTDIENWTQKELPESNNFSAITYGLIENIHDRFISVSTNGTNRVIDSYEFIKTKKSGNQLQYQGVDNIIVDLYGTEDLSFYANLDALEDNANFASWRLDLVDSETFFQKYYGIATLSKDIISGSDYRFYLDSYSIPTTILEGCYRMVIIDTTDESVLYVSNKIRISQNTAPYTKQIRYRNSKNILNFNYEGLSNFKNEFRINLIQRAPSYDTSRVGYDLISGVFNAVRTTLGSNYEFITERYSDLDHEAWNAATIQELEIYNETTGQWESFKRGAETAYEVDWQNLYPLADGSIKLEQVNTYSSNKNV